MKAAAILVFGSLLLTQTFAQVAPTEANLRAAAALGGVTKFSGDGTISLTTPVAINTDTTIDADGHGVTIDGGSVTTLFQVSATGKLTLKGLSLVNGRVKGFDSSNIDGGQRVRWPAAPSKTPAARSLPSVAPSRTTSQSAEAAPAERAVGKITMAVLLPGALFTKPAAA